MAVIKVACPKCGQKVSGDESFYDKFVNCPICTSKIMFPANPSLPPESAPPPQSSGPPPGSDPFPTNPPGSPPPQSSGPPPGTDPFPTLGPAYSSPQPGSFDEAPPQSARSHPTGPSPYEEAPRRDDSSFSRSTGSGTDDIPSPLLGSISLVVGILNTVTLCFLSVVLVPVAIICGHIGLAKAKHSPVKPAPGQTHSMIGVILGYTGLVFTLIALLVLLLFKDQIFPQPAPNG